MANAANTITIDKSLAQTLAEAISDGTYADVIETIKTDEPGEEAAASDQHRYVGQLTLNAHDDAYKRTVELWYRHCKVWTAANLAALQAFGSDDNLTAYDLAFATGTSIFYYCVSVDTPTASTWAVVPAPAGTVAGPGASTNKAIARYVGITGDLIQDSAVVINDAGNITLPALATIDGRDVSVDGAALDTHIANVANPHATTLALALAAGKIVPDAVGPNIVGTANAANALTLAGGASTGATTGQAASLTGGAAADTGAGGASSCIGGAGGATSGAGGAAICRGGAGTAGDSTGGTASCIGGAGQGSAPGAKAIVTGGAGGATGAGADVEITGGSGGASGGNAGGVKLASGAIPGAGAKQGTVQISNTCLEIAKTAVCPGIAIAAGFGRFWVINSSPSAPGFHCDNGTEYQLAKHMPSTTGVHSVRGSTARGSTNTQIVRWTSVVDNTGSPDITYTDSATAGGSWNIDQAGVYAVSVSIDVNHIGSVAIKTAAALSNTFDETSIKVAVDTVAGLTYTLSWTGPLALNDKIWIALSITTNPTGTPINNNRCTVTRVR